MDITTTQEEKIRKAAYKVVGKKNLKNTLPVMNRLMDFVVQGRFSDEHQERNIELGAASALATWLLVKGIKSKKPSYITQGILVFGAVGLTLAFLRKHQQTSAILQNA